MLSGSITQPLKASLLPTIILFFFSINFITNSIEFWFTVPVEQALEKSLLVGQQFYRENEIRQRFFLERISYQLQRKNLTEPDKIKELNHYIQVVQREFDLDAIEIYSANYNRLTYALGKDLENISLAATSPGAFVKDDGEKDLFVHRSGIEGDGFQSLREDQEVEFEVVQGQKGPAAEKVRPV